MAKRKPIPKADQVFTKRTSNIFNGQKKRAKTFSATLDYTLDELRELTKSAVDRPCMYCATKITPYNLSLDHQQPTSRGGAHELHNLAVSCERCNQIKGNMTDAEFALFMQVVSEMPEQAKKSILARLRAGGRFIKS